MPAARTRTAPVKNQAVDFDVAAQGLAPDKPVSIKLSNGTVVRMVNPIDLEWTILAELSSADRSKISYRAVLSMVHPDDVDDFVAAKVTQRELDAISTFWAEHFDLEGRIGSAGGFGA